MVGSAGEGVILDCTASPLKPSEDAHTSWFEQLKLHWPSRFLLDDNRAVAHRSARYQLAKFVL
jgi:hypothetical protein